MRPDEGCHRPFEIQEEAPGVGVGASLLHHASRKTRAAVGPKWRIQLKPSLDGRKQNPRDWIYDR